MKHFYRSSLGILMMLVVGNVLAVDKRCPRISARFERIVAVDDLRLGVFSVRNEGETPIRFSLAAVPVGSSRVELHPLSYNIHSRLANSVEWLPDMTIGTFDQPRGVVSVKSGGSANLYLSVDQVFDDRFPPGTSFFVEFKPAELKCSVRSNEFVPSTPSHIGSK